MPLPSAIASLERFAKIIALFTTVAYFTGLWVVNLYLQQFGGSWLGLLEKQYLFAGVWALMPFVIGAYVAYVSFMLARAHFGADQFRRKPWLPATIVTVASVILLVTISFILSPLHIPFTDWYLEILIAGNVVNAIIYRQFYARPTSVLSDENQRSPESIERNARQTANNVVAGLCLLLSFLAFTGNFGENTYGKIPARWGGGQPMKAKLVLKPDVHKSMRESGLLSAGDTVLMLLVTKDFIVMLSPDSSRLATVRGEIIQGIIITDPLRQGRR